MGQTPPPIECEHCKVGGTWMQTLHAADMTEPQRSRAAHVEPRRIYLHMDCIAGYSVANPDCHITFVAEEDISAS